MAKRARTDAPPPRRAGAGQGGLGQGGQQGHEAAMSTRGGHVKRQRVGVRSWTGQQQAETSRRRREEAIGEGVGGVGCPPPIQEPLDHASHVMYHPACFASSDSDLSHHSGAHP